VWWRGDRWSRWSCAPTRGLGSASPRGLALGWPRRVRSFQRKHELPETGVVDQGTAEALARVDQTVPIVHGDPDYDAVMLARGRFSEAAHKAGF
jgi:hypothetical protein